jgi:hypothetical protein
MTNVPSTEVDREHILNASAVTAIQVIDFLSPNVVQDLFIIRFRHHRPFRFLDCPAFRNAIATACFCGNPSRRSRRMLSLIVFLDRPFLSGIVALPQLNLSASFQSALVTIEA